MPKFKEFFIALLVKFLARRTALSVSIPLAMLPEIDAERVHPVP